MHINKPAQMDSNVTSIKPSFATLAKGLTIEINKPSQEVEEVHTEEAYILDIQEEEQMKPTYETNYQVTQSLYQRCKQLSREAIYPFMDALNFEQLFQFLFPEDQLDESHAI